MSVHSTNLTSKIVTEHYPFTASYFRIIAGFNILWHQFITYYLVLWSYSFEQLRHFLVQETATRIIAYKLRAPTEMNNNERQKCNL